MQQQAAARTSSVSDFPLADSAVNAEADTAAESAGAGVKVDGNINEFLPLEEKIVAMFRTIYDPRFLSIFTTLAWFTASMSKRGSGCPDDAYRSQLPCG